MKCPMCGNEVFSTDKFCPHCGNKMDSDSRESEDIGFGVEVKKKPEEESSEQKKSGKHKASEDVFENSYGIWNFMAALNQWAMPKYKRMKEVTNIRLILIAIWALFAIGAGFMGELGVGIFATILTGGLFILGHLILLALLFPIIYFVKKFMIRYTLDNTNVHEDPEDLALKTILVSMISTLLGGMFPSGILGFLLLIGVEVLVLYALVYHKLTVTNRGVFAFRYFIINFILLLGILLVTIVTSGCVIIKLLT